MTLKDLQFSSLLQSNAINMNEGTVNIPYTGYYMASFHVTAENLGEAEGIVISIKVDGQPIKLYKHKMER